VILECCPDAILLPTVFCFFELDSPVKFILDNWMLITIALSSGFFLLLPVVQGATATGISPAEAVQCMNREKGVVVEAKAEEQPSLLLILVYQALPFLLISSQR
jgi:hypothetical protein